MECTWKDAASVVLMDGMHMEGCDGWMQCIDTMNGSDDGSDGCDGSDGGD